MPIPAVWELSVSTAISSNTLLYAEPESIPRLLQFLHLGQEAYTLEYLVLRATEHVVERRKVCRVERS